MPPDDPIAVAASAPGPGPVAVPSVALLAQAIARLAPPAPDINLSPRGDHVVQVPSWLWIDAEQWAPRTATASLAAVSATARLEPLRVRWQMGNGDTVVCDGPGLPFEARYAERPEATDCRYTYRRTSADQPDLAFTVTATIEWAASWSGSDGDGGDLGIVATTSGEAVRVAELQALVQ